MRLVLVDADRGNRAVTDPYEVRMPGWTWERYVREAPESRFCEYVEGELIMHSPADMDHQQVVGFLTTLLRMYCAARKAGLVTNAPAAIKVAPERGREPDIFVVPSEQRHKAKGKVMEVVPSLIVEVVSSDSRTRDLLQTAGEYAALRVPEYWAVDYERGVLHRYLLQEQSYRVEEISEGRLASTSIAGFWKAPYLKPVSVPTQTWWK